MTVIGSNDYNNPESLLEIAAGQLKAVPSRCPAQQRTGRPHFSCNAYALDTPAMQMMIALFRSSPCQALQPSVFGSDIKIILIYIFSLIHI